MFVVSLVWSSICCFEIFCAYPVLSLTWPVSALFLKFGVWLVITAYVMYLNSINILCSAQDAPPRYQLSRQCFHTLLEHMTAAWFGNTLDTSTWWTIQRGETIVATWKKHSCITYSWTPEVPAGKHKVAQGWKQGRLTNETHAVVCDFWWKNYNKEGSQLDVVEDDITEFSVEYPYKEFRNTTFYGVSWLRNI